MSDLKQLLLDKRIDQFEYDSYILFELNELGRIFLSNKINSLFMHPSEGIQIDNPYTFHCGRMAEWREIKIAIVRINQILKEVENDRRSTDFDGINDTNVTRLSRADTIPFGDRDQ